MRAAIPQEDISAGKETSNAKDLNYNGCNLATQKRKGEEKKNIIQLKHCIKVTL